MPTGADNTLDVVDARSTGYKSMEPRWGLLHTLLGGTEAMRAAGSTYLPQEEKEQPDRFGRRLNRSYLHPAYSNTVKKIAAKPFIKPVTTQGELPDPLAELLEDVNGEGQTLTAFAREAFEIGVKYGLFHILVDYSKVPEGLTLEDERKAGYRARLLLVSPVDLIGWGVENKDGSKSLVQVRIKETQIQSTGTYLDKEVEYVRVYTPTTWELHEKITKDGAESYVNVENGEHSFGSIPLVTCYLTKDGFMTAQPPLDELAYKNLEHWQVYSDQSNLISYARRATLFATGWSKTERKAGIVLSPGEFIAVGADKNTADLKFVEHSGKAIDAGRQHLEDIETTMIVLGLQPFVTHRQGKGTKTATEAEIDESRTQSEAQYWVAMVEIAIEDAIGLAAQWYKVEVPDDFSVDIFQDFTAISRSAAYADALLKAREKREISHRTYLREIKRMGMISDTIDIEEEILELQKEELAALTALTKEEEEETPPTTPTGEEGEE